MLRIRRLLIAHVAYSCTRSLMPFFDESGSILKTQTLICGCVPEELAFNDPPVSDEVGDWAHGLPTMAV